MAEESHLIFDIPQDEIVVSSSLSRLRTVRAARSGGSSRAPEEEQSSTNVLGCVRDSVQEEPFVRIAADQPDPADEHQRNANRANRAGPNSEFGNAVGGTSVRAITFLLIAVACLLLVGSMVLTDVTNKDAKGAAGEEFENTTDVSNTDSDGGADATAPRRASPDGVQGNGRRIQPPEEDRNLFKARRPAPRNSRGPRKSLHRMLKGTKCTSKACVEQGVKLVDELEPKIRPCDDFYQHVCVRWQHRQPSNVQSDRVSVDYALVDLFSELLVNVIRSDATPFPELKFFIDECVRPQPNLFRNVRDAVLRHLDLKGWPYEANSSIPDQTLSVKVGRVLSEIGLETLFSVYRGLTGAVIGQPRNLLLRHFLGSEPQLAARLVGKAYESLVQTMTKNAAAPFEESTMTNVTTIEILIRRMLNTNRAVLDAGRLKNCSTRQMIDLPRLGTVNLHRFFEAAVGGDSTMPETTSVRLSDTDYFDRMRTIALTKHDLLNYVTYRVVLELTPLISNWTLRSTLASVTYSRYAEFSERLDPAQMCVRFLERYEPVVPLYLTFKRALELLGGPSVIRTVLDVLKKTFLADLQNSTIYSNMFKQHATNQVKDIYWEALMPYWLSEQKAAESYAEGLTSWTGGFLNAWATLDPPYDHLEIPLPVFDFMMPNDSSTAHLHLPRVGPRVYRELHRFLWHEAINYDLERPASEESHYFDRLRRCLENQYRDIDFNPSRVPFNSARTSASDLLDLLAVRTAFHAYVRQLGAHDGDYRLSGAPNLSGQQLFFLYYARSHCERLNPRFAVKLMTNGPVSPAWYRVNGPLRNMHDFAIAFGCPPGTAMNPADKCL
ncbi:hypothetical protein MTO96_035323 [Rhipicephalus appendiculatus]